MAIRLRVSWNIWNVLASYFNSPNSLLIAESAKARVYIIGHESYIILHLSCTSDSLYATDGSCLYKAYILASLLGCRFPVDPKLDKNPLNKLTWHPHKNPSSSLTRAPRINTTWNEFPMDIMNLFERSAFWFVQGFLILVYHFLRINHVNWSTSCIAIYTNWCDLD